VGLLRLEQVWYSFLSLPLFNFFYPFAFILFIVIYSSSLKRYHLINSAYLVLVSRQQSLLKWTVPMTALIANLGTETYLAAPLVAATNLLKTIALEVEATWMTTMILLLRFVPFHKQFLPSSEYFLSRLYIISIFSKLLYFLWLFQ
jgi:hypothetical protein